MAAKTAHHIVSHWFAQTMATGPLSRDDAAHAQAIAARDDLVKRLEAGKGSEAEAVRGWFVEKISTGPIARNTEAHNQAFRAKDDLIKRLTSEEVSPPAPAPAKPKPKAKTPSKAKPAPAPPPAEPTKANTETPA